MSHTYTLPVRVNQGHGQPLILLHGLGNKHKSWSHVLKALDYDRFHVIALDLLGFGKAPKPPLSECEYDAASHATAVIATIEKLGLRKVMLAGHSMGGIVAIEVAKQRPDLVGRLVLLGPPLYRRMPRNGWWAKLTHAESAYYTIYNFLIQQPELTMKTAMGLDTLSPLLDGMDITEETWPAFVASLRRTVMQLQSYRDLVNLTTPTLLVYGTLDIFVIKRNLQKAARANRRYIRYETLLGPHEITPLQGKTVAELLATEAKRKV